LGEPIASVEPASVLPMEDISSGREKTTVEAAAALEAATVVMPAVRPAAPAVADVTRVVDLTQKKPTPPGS
jgi:hypothetical protein